MNTRMNLADDAATSSLINEIKRLNVEIDGMRAENNRLRAMVTTYPRRTDRGETIWACCVSTIGPTCQHRSQPEET